ncbi:Flocculation protein [Actinidia chinensis var. chinensis]|uniref:Flocculation protein n=1 Tax=Actinidia chinensis var. chinensis TaxID=1590841 RepID=A0A2R6QUW0_ACTCC|nr:Flocculation protein [Actinidia chinensis var. chinensis]
MLQRSFKPAKCKTSLKLASSRLKLLKNKKEVVVKQLKRELAQLLEAGQDQTARIRVEHVVREEKTMAAFDLLEIYCELIVARLPIIEAQKNCPIDLKEAITSVVFASPRCADIPELHDVRKHFTAKYGKEFISAAVELRPECGVSRMLVEKLSAKAPDGQTKLKILTAIAEEHNVKWDPKSFGEKELNPPDDLLNGPNTFEKASKMMHTEPPFVQPPPQTQVPPSPVQTNNVPVNFGNNASSSTSSQNFVATDVGGSQTTVPAASHHGVRPSGSGSERMEVRHSYYEDENSFSSRRQGWNMEFTDATSAAQAAAESAERASMAARAAAELSSRGKITSQYSTESQKSNIYSSRYERHTENTASKLPTQQFPKNSEHNSFHSRNPQKQTDQVDNYEHDNPDEAAENIYRDGCGSSKRSSRSSSNVDDKVVNDFQKVARNSQNGSFVEEAIKTEKRPVISGKSVKKQSIGSEEEFVSGQQGGPQSDNFNYFGEERIEKQASNASSRSHSSNREASENVYSDGHGRNKKPGQSASIDEYTNDFRKGDRNPQRSLFEEEAVKADKSPVYSGMSMKKQSVGSEDEFMSGQQGGLQPDNFNYFAEERITKQASSVFSRSHSSNCGDGYDVSPSRHPKFEIDGGEDPFVAIDQGIVHRDAVKASSYNDANVVFDESISDDYVDVRFDTQPKYDRQESRSYSASPPKEPRSHLSVNTDTWSPTQSNRRSDKLLLSASHVSAEWHSPPVFDESLTKSSISSPPREVLPVTYDKSEGLSWESEDELHKSRLGRKTEPSSLPHKESIFFEDLDDFQSESHGLTGSFHTEKGDSGSNRKQNLHYSFDDEELVEVSSENNQRTEFSAQSRRKFVFDETPSRQSSKRTKPQIISNDKASEPFYNQVEERKSQLSLQHSRLSLVNEVKATQNTYNAESSDTMEDDESFGQSSLESGKELNLGMLTGGLRNKGYGRPPYIRNPSVDASPSRKAAEDNATTVEHPPDSPVDKSSLKSVVSTKLENKPSWRTPITNYDLDTDDSDDLKPQNSRREKEPYSRKASKEVLTMSRLRAQVTVFDTDDNDDDDDLPKQAFTSTGRPGSGLSRRTKATPASGKSSYSKMLSSSETLPEPRSQIDADDRKVPSRSLYRSETPPETQSQTDADAKKMPSRRSYRSETPPAPRSQTDVEAKKVPSRNSYRSEISPDPESQIDADAKRMPSRSSYRSETAPAPEPRSQTDANAKRMPLRSSYRSETPPEPRSQTDADAKRIPSRSSYPSETPPEPWSQTDADAKKVPSMSSYRSESPPKPRSRTDADAKKVPPSRSSYHSDTPPKPRPQPTNSGHREHSPDPSAAKQATSKPESDSSVSIRKENLKSSATERPSSPLKTAKSGSTESPKASTSSGEAPSRESSLKKASHVHPKLPDYDTLTAHLQSLRVNRQ